MVLFGRIMRLMELLILISLILVIEADENSSFIASLV